MTNPIYTADAIASELCDRALPSYEGRHPKAQLVAQEAAKLMVGYSAKACREYAMASDSFEADAKAYVKANLSPETKRNPYPAFSNPIAFLRWGKLIVAIISAIIQAMCLWYFASNDSDELRAALKGMA